MKKSFFCVVSFLPLMLASCGGSGVKGVVGKTFTFSSCVRDAVKTGTSEQFYDANNPAGATKEAVVDTLVNRLYGHGTSDATFTELTFSDNIGPSNITYKGSSLSTYEVNYTKLSEYSSTSLCYYMDLGNDWTSLHFIELNLRSGIFEDKVFSCGSNGGYTSSRGSYSYSTEAVDTAVQYDAANKKLDITLDVTYECIENESTITSTMTYVLDFQEK